MGKMSKMLSKCVKSVLYVCKVSALFTVIDIELMMLMRLCQYCKLMNKSGREMSNGAVGIIKHWDGMNMTLSEGNS